MSYVTSFGNNAARVFLWPGNKACDALGVEQSEFRDLVRMLVNSLVWTTLGVVVVALTA
jgi:hypothetical protein